MSEPELLAPLAAACGAELARLLADPDVPGDLAAAMRHAVLGGGKRLRPVLVLLAARAAGAADAVPRLVRPACALELVHAYSLVHDDLPAMDDAQLRHGRPACHRVYGEALAVLAGDALQALAFEMLAAPVPGVDVAWQCAALGELAAAAGPTGMCGGQAMDLAAVADPPDDAGLALLQARKTGALFRCAARVGGHLAGAPLPVLSALGAYGSAFGRAFQIADDVLDVIGDPGRMGKTAGGDAGARKVTFASRFGVARATALAREAAQEACAAVSALGAEGEALARLALFAAGRDR